MGDPATTALKTSSVPAATVNQGLNGLSIPVFDAFTGWVEAATTSGSRLKALTSKEVAEVATAVFAEERGQDDACQSGWVWLEVSPKEDRTLGDVRVTRFGGDCCGEASCERTAQGQHLHFLRAVARKDWATVAQHLPDDGAITFVDHTPAGESRKTVARAAIAQGAVAIAACEPLESRPACDDAVGEAKAFTCHCQIDGARVTYSYEWPASPRGLATLSLISSRQD